MANEGFSLPSESDPVLGRNGSPLGYLNLAADALSPSNIQGFAQPAIDSLTDAGLGLGRAVGRGIDAITPSSDTIHRLGLAMEAAGAAGQGRTPLFVHLQDQQNQMQLRRDAIAQQAAQAEETKRQNQWEDVFKIAGNDKLSPPQQIANLKELGKSNPHAAAMANSINEKMLGDFHTYKDFLPRKPEDYQQGLMNGSISWPQVAAEISVGKSTHDEELKALAKDRAMNRQIQGLLDRFRKDPSSMSDTELDQIAQYSTGQKERGLKIDKLRQDLKLGQASERHLNAQTKDLEGPKIVGHYTNPDGEQVGLEVNRNTGEVTRHAGIPINRQQTQEVDPKLTPEQGGRVSAMNMSLNNIADLRTMLVPDGKTVNRRILATAAFGGLPFSQGRDVERFIEDAIETKLRLQTGAAANKDEVIKEAAKFKPKQLDSDETIIGKFDKLETYMQDAFNAFDPTGVVRARLGASGGNIGAPPIPFDQANEQLKKSRPNWTEKDRYRELARRGVRP